MTTPREKFVALLKNARDLADQHWQPGRYKDEAFAAVLQAYDEAAGREGQPPAVAPVAEFNKAGGDLVADEQVQSAYSWFREGWHARHAYTHPAPKTDAAAPDCLAQVLEQKLLPDSGQADSGFVKGWNACRMAVQAMLAAAPARGGEKG